MEELGVEGYLDGKAEWRLRVSGVRASRVGAGITFFKVVLCMYCIK
jgi:hypothetical protein